MNLCGLLSKVAVSFVQPSSDLLPYLQHYKSRHLPRPEMAAWGNFFGQQNHLNVNNQNTTQQLSFKKL